MKNIVPYTLSLGLLCLAACHKDNSTLPLPPLDSAGTGKDINLDLTYPDKSDSAQKDQWEVIISEPAGKLLLDTIAPVNTALKTHLHTASYVVNVTSVFYNATWKIFDVSTYLNVNPRNWTAMPSPYFSFLPVNAISPTRTTTYYTHPPYLNNFEATDFNDLIVSDYTLEMGLAGLPSYQPADAAYQPGGLLTVSNWSHDRNPVYTLFPQLGLYNFHTPPATGNDTVDLTHMDTAAMINYALPSTSFSFFFNTLLGYADTTNLSRSMTLFTNEYNVETQYPVDLEYPPTGVQAYQLDLEAKNPATTELIAYLNYDTKVRSSIGWLTSADYTLHSNLQDSFAVSFDGGVRPTYYTTAWHSGNITLDIFSAPDGATLHPYTWLTHLGSKLLNGQSISSLILQDLYFIRATGLPSDYNGYLNAFAVPSSHILAPVGTAVVSYERSW